MIALIEQVQGLLCLALKKSPEITHSTGHIRIKNVFPSELNRRDGAHQISAPKLDQNPCCVRGCEKCGLAEQVFPPGTNKTVTILTALVQFMSAHHNYR